MIAYAFKRSILAILVALTVSMISFSLLYISSDPAIAMAGKLLLTLTLKLYVNYMDSIVLLLCNT